MGSLKSSPSQPAAAGAKAKWFTVAEANRALPLVSRIARDVAAIYARLEELRRQRQAPVGTDRQTAEECERQARRTAERLDELVGRHLPQIHIFGGGSQNRLLNQLTADVTGRTVVAGPVEATAIGNILVQALALGLIHDISEGRQLVRRSFDLQIYEPQSRSGWDEAYTRYCRLRAG